MGGSWGSWANIANSASLTTYTVTGLTATKTYAFQMRAFNSTGAGQWSNEATNHPPPAAPADVTATTGGLRQVVLLSWTAATTAARITKYQYRLSDDGGSTWDPDWTNIVGSGASTTSYTVSGLEDATPYTVELRAFNAGGASPAVRKTVTTAAPPDAPENLTATPGDQQVTLRWQRPATGGSPILAYQVRKKKGSGSFDGWAHIANSARLTSHTVGALEEDKSYTFELRALNAVGNGAVASVEGGTLAPPAAPENLTATPGVEQVTLSWTTAFDGGSAITTYQVRRKTGSGSFGGWDNFGGPATTSHTVTSLDAAQSYTFEVRAENVLGEGAVASVEGRTLGPPEPPENLHATPAFEQVTLSWTTPGDGGSAITTYHVRRKTGSGSFGNWTNIPGSGPRTKSHTVPDLTNGAAYTFELRAVSAVGPGEGSSVTATPAAPPTAPLELTASPGEGAVTLRWKAPQPAADRAGVTGYEVRLRDLEPELVVGIDPPWSPWQPAGKATRYRADGLEVGKEYEFQVRATSAVGVGESSAGATATPVARPAGKPSAPKGLRVRTTDSSRADLRWLVPDNTGGSQLVGYRIEVCTVADCFEDTAWEVVVDNTRSAAAAEQTYVDEGIGGLRHRRYRVRAINTGFGAGDWSAPARLPRTEVTHFRVGWGNDHRTLVVDFNVAQPDGEDVYVLLHQEDDPQTDRTVQSVALTQAALGGTQVALMFGGLQGDTPYEATLDFRDSFDSPRRLTARGRTMLEQHRTSNTLSRPTLSVADATAHEGAGVTLDFVVTLDPVQPEATVTVDYATANGTATAGTDYVATSGTLMFYPGETEMTVPVTILDDDVEDSGETFELVLSNPWSGADLQDARATGIITNTDDSPAEPVALTARFAKMPAEHAGEGTFTFRVAFSEAIDVRAADGHDHGATPPGTGSGGTLRESGVASVCETDEGGRGVDTGAVPTRVGRGGFRAGAQGPTR